MKELKVLTRFIKPYIWWIMLATISMVVVTATSMAGPEAISRLVATVEDGVEGKGSLNDVKLIAIIVVAIYIVRAFTRFSTNYVSHYAAWKILEDIRSYLYNHLQRLSVRFFKEKSTGELMSRLINDTRNFEILLAHAIPTLIVNGLMFLGIFIILFFKNPTLTLYTLIPIPLLGWMVLKFTKVSRPLFRQTQDRMGEVNSILQDNFTGIQEIKSFTKEDYENKRMRKSIANHIKAMLKALRFSNGFHPAIEFVSSLGTVIVILFGGILAFNGEMEIEDLVAFLLYLQLFYQPITSLGQIYEGLQQALASSERVIDLLNEESEIKEIDNPVILSKIKGEIEFRNISFHYIDKIPVLKNISFLVKPGQTLALVGATGVGKTTLASLIPRFYDPIEGSILIDNIDIRNVTLESLRRNISLVSQDVFLFNATVKENILYGQSNATDEEVISAAKTANAHEFIMHLEKGYETIVGERGVKLSGGQKQRISIARAILKNAPILILDEATSSVDTQTEKLIQEALNELKKNKTTIVIAHRLSTIKDADQIVVLKEGEIIEQGKHDDLLKLNGLYSKLCKAQSTDELTNLRLEECI